MIKNPLREKLAQILRHELVRNRFKQNRMADLLEITPSAVSQMLQAKITPSIAQLNIFCEALGLSRQRTFELRCLLAKIRCGSDNLQSPLGEMLVQLRREKSMTQEELAFAAGIPENVVDLLETTPDISPDISDLRKIAEALNVGANELYEAAGLNWKVQAANNAPIQGLGGLTLREAPGEYTPGRQAAAMKLRDFWVKLTSSDGDVSGSAIAKLAGFAPGDTLEVIASGSELDLAGRSTWKLEVKELDSLCPGELALVRFRKSQKRALLVVDSSRSSLVGRKLFRKSNKAIQITTDNFDIIVPVKSIAFVPNSKR